MKVLGPTADFQTWGSHKRTENPQRIWLWMPVGFDHKPSTGLGKQTLGEHKQNLVHTSTQEKGAVTPQETDPDLPMSKSLQWRRGSAVACCRVGGTEGGNPCMGPFEGGHHYLHYLHHSLASGQRTGREHSPNHQQKIGLKIYWAWARPWKQDRELTVSQIMNSFLPNSDLNRRK